MQKSRCIAEISTKVVGGGILFYVHPVYLALPLVLLSLMVSVASSGLQADSQLSWLAWSEGR